MVNANQYRRRGGRVGGDRTDYHSTKSMSSHSSVTHSVLAFPNHG